MELTVGIGSTWSLRAWICSQLAQVDIDIHKIDLSKPKYKTEIVQGSKAGLVPFLSYKGKVIHDSLAIAEFFNEQCKGALYPNSELERALARSLCAELHSGFINLRSHCPFYTVPVEPLTKLSNELNDEIVRVRDIFESATLPFMFDNAGVVDAFYSILAYRLKSYGIVFKGKAGKYQESLLTWPKLVQAIDLAKSWDKTTQC